MFLDLKPIFNKGPLTTYVYPVTNPLSLKEKDR
jgi:hypothetical protein